MSKYFSTLAALSVAGSAAAAPVTGWVTTNGDAGFSGGSAATDSPVLTDADGDTIAANFASVTLADGEFITLTGSVSINGALVGDQFRWGLWDGDNPVTAGDGGGYVGYNAQSTINLTDGGMFSSDGSLTNPFSGGAGTEIQANPTGTAGAVAADTTLNFTMTIARDGANVDITASLVDPTSSYNIQYAVQDTPASPGSFTYDSVALLIGGSQNSTAATYSNIDVTTGIVPEPGSLALLGLGGLALLRRRRA